jgi:alkanesulfonate monooxygenase SsuD/methylene tetrahydromethanopterin reductase-like flavin-dependent oxidoreductase (luciferase family)
MIIGAGLDVRLGLDVATLTELGVEAVGAGFESLWTPSGGVPDAFQICSGWSIATKAVSGTPVRTGTAVVPVARMWHPHSLAIEAATTGLIGEGNFILGIGTGGAGREFFDAAGLPNKPIAVMRDYLEITRALLRGESVTHQGSTVSIGPTQLTADLPVVPVYIAALGAQMLRLGGSHADGVCLNWASPERIAVSREEVGRGATSAGRSPDEVVVSMYIRVCVDEDVDAARRAFAAQVLAYALVRPGGDPTLAYRGMFGEMGFDDVLSELEARRDAGASIGDLIDEVPDELLTAVGYYGTPAGAAERFAHLATGLDEAIVRVITTKPDPAKVRLALEALTPARIRAAA